MLPRPLAMRIDRLILLALLSIATIGCGKSTKTENVQIEGSDDVRLALTLHWDRIAEQIEELGADSNRPEGAEWLDWRNRVGLDVTHLYVLQEGSDEIDAVVIIPDQEQKIWNELCTNSLFQTYLQKNEDGSLGLSESGLPPEIPKEEIPDIIRQLSIKWHDDRILVASAERMHQIESGKWNVESAKTTQLIERVDLSDGFFSLAAIVPKETEFDLEEELKNKNVVKQIPGMGRMVNVFTSFAEAIQETLQTTDALAISVSFPKSDHRRIRYAQLFSSADLAAAAHKQLTSSVDDDAGGLTQSVATLLQDKKIKGEVSQSNRLLEMNAEWSAEADEKIGSLARSTVMQFTVRQNLGGSLEPTKGPIQTRYTLQPNFVSLSAKKLKSVVEKQLRQQFFPGWANDQGDSPSMHAELDTVGLPNRLFAEGSYQVLSVKAAKKEVLRKDDRPKFTRTLQLAHAGSQYLEIPFRKGTKKSDLQSASIQFTLDVPRQVDIAKFKATDAPGTKKKAGKRRVEIRKIARDVACVRYQGKSSARLIAFDQSGRTLSSHESMQGGGSAVSRFSGEIDQLWVALPVGMEKLVVKVNASLNRGEQLQLPNEPSKSVRVRFDSTPQETYQSIHDNELENLKVEFQPSDEVGNQEHLFIQLPRASQGIKADWELYWFAADRPTSLAGFSYSQNAQLAWRPQQGLGKATAVAGWVKTTIPTEFKTISFTKKTKSKKVGDQVVKLHFKHNHITYSPSKLKVMALHAFDADGRRLKTEYGRSVNRGATLVPVWGQPQRVELVVSGRTIEKTLDVKVVREGTNEEKFAKYFQDIARYHKALLALTRLEKAVSKGPYGYDELAGLHYLHNNQGSPLELIPVELAHACPQGAKRFGFDPKPYRGYYFKRIPFAGQTAPSGSQKRTFQWKNGELQISAPGHGTVVAIPVSAKDPTLISQWGSAYMKFLDGQSIQQVPTQLSQDGWTGVTPVQDQNTTRLIGRTR